MKQRKPYYFYLQSIGLLPFSLILIVASYSLEIYTGRFVLLIGVISLCIEIFYKIVYHRFLLMLGVSTLTLLQFVFFKYFLEKLLYDSLVFTDSVLLIGLLIINILFIRKFYKFFCHDYLENEISGSKKVMDNSVYEFMYMSRLLLYLSTFYGIATVTFNVISPNNENVYNFLNFRLGFILIIVYFVYESIRIILLNIMLSKEVWLPIVNDSLSYVGQVEKQESFSSDNCYLHPHLRVIIMNGNKIYLQPNQIKRSLSGLHWDTPVSVDLVCRKTLDNVLVRILEKYISLENKNVPRKLLSYKYESNVMNRIVLLYVLNLSDESHFIRKSQGGKFWTPAQIEAELKNDVFSDCFKQEYKLLKNTILLAWNYMEGKDEDK